MSRVMVFLFVSALAAATPRQPLLCSTGLSYYGVSGRRLPEIAHPTAEDVRRALSELAADPEQDPRIALACRTQNCFPCTARLQQVLLKKGIRTKRFATDFYARVRDREGRERVFTAYHWFLVLPGTPEILIDPTYLQYFRWADAPAIFVGTAAQMVDFHEDHDLIYDLEFRPRDPSDIVYMIYGLGDFSDQRVSDDVRLSPAAPE